ncbi:hypothetical protein GCM10009839_63490 [Catenulispora yoronensis]|uniref:RiboL-PSP-HEPN domain-containing protein n=1 Tax=Catenulispora yoronensis TaxID=450799 RepID=A0ABP5GNI5_9ACTN
MKIEEIVSEVERIKRKFDELNDADPEDYLPPLLNELRKYIFQIHASYERSLELLLLIDFFNGYIEYESGATVLDELSFFSKLKLVHKAHPKFPHRLAEKLNKLRNDFAHKKGSTLRAGWNDDQKRMEEFQFLEKAHDELESFWKEYVKLKKADQGVVAEHIEQT